MPHYTDDKNEAQRDETWSHLTNTEVTEQEFESSNHTESPWLPTTFLLHHIK